MTNTQLPSAQEILVLLAQNGKQFTDKEAFVNAFKSLYPNLSAVDRASLLVKILAYVDSTVKLDTFPIAA